MSEGTRFPISATAAAEDVLAGRVHLTLNLEDEVNCQAEKILWEAGYASRVNLPLIVGNHSIGSLNVVSRHRGYFSAAHLPSLQQVANAIAIAIENKRLFDAEQARRAELSALYNLSRALADLNQVQAVTDVVTQRGVETTHVTFARLALCENNQVAIRAAYPTRIVARDLEIGRCELLTQLPILQAALTSAQPVLVTATDADLSDHERQFLLLDWARVVCITPLRVDGRVLGCLMFGEIRSERREPFDDDKIRLARSIGDQTASALHRAELFTQMESAFVQTVLVLAQAMDAKDSYTADHAERMADMSAAIGRELGFSAVQLEELRFGATLHDVGKIGVPDAILQKGSALTQDEWQNMRRHPAIGEQILKPVPRLAGAARIVRHHHERFDGTGYPDGLAGEQIPLGARILTVVDAYSAITDRRVYKNARSHEVALDELKRHAGTQFDPRIVEIFIRLFEHEPDAQ